MTDTLDVPVVPVVAGSQSRGRTAGQWQDHYGRLAVQKKQQTRHAVACFRLRRLAVISYTVRSRQSKLPRQRKWPVSGRSEVGCSSLRRPNWGCLPPHLQQHHAHAGRDVRKTLLFCGNCAAQRCGHPFRLVRLLQQVQSVQSSMSCRRSVSW